MTAAEAAVPIIKGGAFLLEQTAPQAIYTFEDLSDEHRAIARTAEEFWRHELEPNLASIWNHEPGAAGGLLRRSAELGLTAILIPEKFGGLEMDLSSSLVIEEHLGRDASYAAWHGAHTGIGTLPLLYFGTEEQKQRYLPKLAKAELIAAYALTEPQAGSDALASQTRADLSPDGTHYVLNGQKMWITNGSAADLFTVFAKVGGEKFTAFLVERNFGGVTSGAEERKMGIKGSSTTAVFFENVRVPAANVLGEVGRGHIIAFNILNLGRLKLGALAVGGAKDVLATCLRYGKERRAFGQSISEFGAIKHKMAEMAIRIFAAESMTWRTVGLIEKPPTGAGTDGTEVAETILKNLEEFAVECSIVKVFGSETLDYVVDEGVQIHGGYGYHQDYSVERAYRDARINRIFEGTNEINRLLITGMLMKRAGRGMLALIPAAQALVRDLANVVRETELSDADLNLVRNAKKIVLLSLGMAYAEFGSGLEQQQEVSMNLADIVIELFAMESTLLRTRKLAARSKGLIAADMCAVFLRDAMARVELAVRNILGACKETDDRHRYLSALRRLSSYEPVNAVALRRRIAGHLLGRERYAI